jgi:exopolysaccharide production protein ExoZ
MHANVGKLTGLQAMRGVAAFLVVLHHAAGTVALPKYTDVVIADGILTPLGRAGVDLFFVLSGFVIYYVHHRDIGRAQSFRRYMLRRLSRIYPTYWGVFFLMLALFLGHPSFGGDTPHSPRAIIQSFLLIPFTTPGEFTIVGVAWTLSHELLFYTLFGLVILDSRFGARLFAGWFCCLVVAALFLPTPLPPPFNFLLHVKNLEFFIGMGVARLVLAEGDGGGRTAAASWLLLLAGAACFVGTSVVELQGYDFQISAPTLFYGLGAGMMILAFASLEMRGRLGRVPRPLVFLGAASYSLYLIHHPIVIGLVKAAHATGLDAYAADSGAASMLLLALLTAPAVAAGIVLYITVERPALRTAQRALAKAPEPAAVPAYGVPS